MASKQKLAGNGLATTSANATTASGSRKSRRSSQNHATNHSNSETHSAPGSSKFEQKFLSVATTSQNFQVLSENTVLQQQYESAKPYHQHHHQQQPQQQHRCQQQHINKLVSAHLATLRLDFDSFHLYSNIFPPSATTARDIIPRRKFFQINFNEFQ